VARRNVIVATLAVGSDYADLAAKFLPHLVRRGNATLVVTDRPETFAGLDEVEVVPHVLDGTHVWHGKRHVVRAALERANTVYFVDGDHRLYNGWEDRVPLLPLLPPGLGAHRPPAPTGYLIPRLMMDPKFVEPGRAWLDRMAVHLGVIDWPQIPWWGDWIFTVTRDTDDDSGTWFKFLDAWDRFAIWRRDNLPPHALIGSDNIAMAFAAAACGWVPEQRLEMAPFIHAFSHMFFGAATNRDRLVP